MESPADPPASFVAFFRVAGFDLYLCPREGPRDFRMQAGSPAGATVWPTRDRAEAAARRFAGDDPQLTDLGVRELEPEEVQEAAREAVQEAAREAARAAPWRRGRRHY